MSNSKLTLDEALRAFSEGRIARSDVETAAGEAVSFGALLIMLSRAGFPLPRAPSDPQNPGRVALRAGLKKASRRGGR